MTIIFAGFSGHFYVRISTSKSVKFYERDVEVAICQVSHTTVWDELNLVSVCSRLREVWGDVRLLPKHRADIETRKRLGTSY